MMAEDWRADLAMGSLVTSARAVWWSGGRKGLIGEGSRENEAGNNYTLEC